MMEISSLLFLGYNGEIKELLDFASISKPLIELDSNQNFPLCDAKILSLVERPINEVQKFFGSVYKSWGRFGYMGDIIAVKKVKTDGGYFYFLDYIGRLAINKPGLAVDLLMVIRSKYNDYFVGVKRKYNPGQGKLALPGGFIDVKGYHLDTPVEAIIHEAREEIGLTIEAVNPNELGSYLPAETSVIIDYFDSRILGKLIPLGIFPTGDNEKMPTIGLKRVYHTTAFALVLDMSELYIAKERIQLWLKAGDDAANLVILKIDSNVKLEFGLDHHKKIFDTLMKNWQSLQNL